MPSTVVRPDSSRRERRYIGYRPDDYTTQYGRYYRPQMQSLPNHVIEALNMHGVTSLH